MAVIDALVAGGDQVSDWTEDVAVDIEAGSAVEVRNRFDGRWARGFEVTGSSPDGYRVRRLSDGRELPTDFASQDIRLRRERKRNSWWY